MRKYMSLTEFVKLGFVQEINRQFLHPRGLALEYIVDEDGNVADATGLRIWDGTEDPEGIYFAKEQIDEKKIEMVNKLLYDKQGPRLQSLGYIVQPPKSLQEARKEESAI